MTPPAIDRTPGVPGSDKSVHRYISAISVTSLLSTQQGVCGFWKAGEIQSSRMTLALLRITSARWSVKILEQQRFDHIHADKINLVFWNICKSLKWSQLYICGCFHLSSEKWLLQVSWIITLTRWVNKPIVLFKSISDKVTLGNTPPPLWKFSENSSKFETPIVPLIVKKAE